MDYVCLKTKFQKKGIKVALILNIPNGDEFNPKYMAQRSLKSFPHILTLKTSGAPRVILDEKLEKINADLISISKRLNIEVIDPMAYLCKNYFCQNVNSDGEPIYKDDGHLRPYFVKIYITFIDHLVLKEKR